MTSEERIEKIERQLAHMRWFNRALIACIVLSLGLWFIPKTFGPATAWARTLQASSFVLVDENGKPRASLSVLEGGPALVLNDENGKLSALLEVIKEGPRLLMHDENGKSRVLLLLAREGAGLSLSDENGMTRAGLLMGKNGPKLVLYDENGKSIWSAPERVGVIPIK